MVVGWRHGKQCKVGASRCSTSRRIVLTIKAVFVGWLGGLAVRISVTGGKVEEVLIAEAGAVR